MVSVQHSNADDMLEARPRIEELVEDDVNDHIIPPWLAPAYLSFLKDGFETVTSQAQQKTQEECMPSLLLQDDSVSRSRYGVPHLNRQGHLLFLHKVFDRMPAPYAAMDAARPWFFYWALQGMTILGDDAFQYKERLVDTLKPLQNKSGGFAGGHGQQSHCATTYACVLALTMTQGLDMIDRQAMWHFMGQLKQSDGGFRVAVMAEEDIRGAYCAMTIITLLKLPLELPPDAPARADGITTFVDGLGEYIGRCQTYEGGVGGAPTNEAHGAYAFCALACLCIIDAPHISVPRYLDVPALIRWILNMQATPEGGFAGRTNKLVDACYSHWVGGCWSLLNAAQQRTSGSLWNRQALHRYLLTCCQQPGRKAGMRDKPSTRPDAYHTCYSLAGLSAAQNHYTFDTNSYHADASRHRKAPFHWNGQRAQTHELEQLCIDPQDQINPVHPVFVIPFSSVAYAGSLPELDTLQQ